MTYYLSLVFRYFGCVVRKTWYVAHGENAHAKAPFLAGWACVLLDTSRCSYNKYSDSTSRAARFEIAFMLAKRHGGGRVVLHT